MTADPSLLGTAEFNMTAQLRTVCLDLDKRIARLAMLLGLELDVPADMSKLLHHARFSLADSVQEKRLWEELRGLVMLRDEMEKRCVDMVGPAAAGEILVAVETEMIRLGFPPGVDGIDMKGLLNLPSRD